MILLARKTAIMTTATMTATSIMYMLHCYIDDYTVGITVVSIHFLVIFAFIITVNNDTSCKIDIWMNWLLGPGDASIVFTKNSMYASRPVLLWYCSIPLIQPTIPSGPVQCVQGFVKDVIHVDTVAVVAAM